MHLVLPNVPKGVFRGTSPNDIYNKSATYLAANSLRIELSHMRHSIPYIAPLLPAVNTWPSVWVVVRMARTCALKTCEKVCVTVCMYHEMLLSYYASTRDPHNS